jgi:predicted ferric reductase
MRSRARDTAAVTETALALPAPARRARAQHIRIAAGIFFWGLFLGNFAAIVWMWVANHNLDFSFAPNLTAAWMARLGGLTGLLGAYLALVQVLLLARLPFLGRLAGFDRLTVWHRWNGYACLLLVVAHTVMAILGYSLETHRSFPRQFWRMVGENLFPGMVTATIGLALFVLVSVTSVMIVRRRLNYELWYAVHLTAYAAIALSWFHEIPTGGDLALSPNAARYWRILFFGTLALLAFRLLSPLANALRFRLRVAEVHAEGPNVTSIRITGRQLDKLHAQSGQFFLWRFLTPGYWWTAHPFSLSAAPDGRSFRISVKASGDHSARMGSIPVGTRVIAEGPFGTFIDSVRHRGKVLLIAGGIGITPVRALAEVMDGDVVVIHRVLSDEQVVFQDEMAELAARRGLELHYVVGDHLTGEGRSLLSAGHLRELVPDIAERDVYVCGPPGMVAVAVGYVRQAGVPHRRLHVERFAL